LGNHGNSRSLYAVPGLDYVAHDDVLPYSTNEKAALQHELFDKFLIYHPDKEPCFVAQETLRAWQKKNHPWLELSDVHKETTENIRITVIPFYMGCRESQTTSVYWVSQHEPTKTKHTNENGKSLFRRDKNLIKIKIFINFL